MSGEREGGGSGGGGGGGGGGNSSPKAQLHRLCSHLVGGAGGGAALISDHYKSGLQLLTSSSSYAQPLQESAVVERMQRKLVRAGRDREAADVSRLHSKLVSSSKEILQMRHLFENLVRIHICCLERWKLPPQTIFKKTNVDIQRNRPRSHGRV